MEGVLAARALTVVFVTDCDPADASVVVRACDITDRLIGLAADLIQSGAGFTTERVDAAAEEVAGDVLQVTAEP